MAQNPELAGMARTIVEKLEAIRSSHQDDSEGDRRALFRDALQAELGNLGDDRAAPVLESIRSRLIDDARERDRRSRELEQQLRELRSEVASLESDRDRLAKENQELTSSVATSRGASISGNLQEFLEGLKAMTEEEQLDVASTTITGDGSHLFLVVRELFAFALNHERAVNDLLFELNVGPGGGAGLDTRQFKLFKKKVRDRFRSCLENEEALGVLKKTLTRSLQFVVALHNAHEGSLHAGQTLISDKLDPQKVLDANKRMVGYNYEEAWNSLRREVDDLANLTREGLWSTYFDKSFREHLAGYMDPDRDD